MPGDKKNSDGFEAYKVGDSDIRPWGRYIVTAAGVLADGREFCEKQIVVEPGKILSLQLHEYRVEQWCVDEGTLIVVCNGRLLRLSAGETIDIPRGAVHCMANLTTGTCKVYERQKGLCREADSVRFLDAYGRKTKPFTSDLVALSAVLYRDVLNELNEIEPSSRRAAG
jgi:mannose-6-phosphate isomerase-like protein (cupin superfamily)